VSTNLAELATRYYFLSECCCLKLAVLFSWGALSDKSTGLQFAVQSLNGPSRTEPVTPHLRLPKPGGPGPYIYIPQEQGGPVIPLGTGFPFRCLLRLAGLRWRHSNPPLRVCCIVEFEVEVTLRLMVSQYVLVLRPLWDL
jgi:hypothetical protein